MNVGIIGVGAMGAVAAEHLLGAGHTVLGYDRRPEALDALVAAGGHAVAGPGELADAEVVLDVVWDDAAVRDVTLGPGGLVETLSEHAVHVLMASVSPSLATELAAAHDRRSGHFLAASIFGRPEAARARDLLINCAGPEAAWARAEPVLHELGRPRRVGPRPEQAMVVKTVGNSMIHSSKELLREMFALLRADGIPESAAKELVVDTLFGSPLLSGYAQRYLDDPASIHMIPMARKDRKVCLEAAAELGVDLPVVSFLAAHDLP